MPPKQFSLDHQHDVRLYGFGEKCFSKLGKKAVRFLRKHATLVGEIIYVDPALTNYEFQAVYCRLTDTSKHRVLIDFIRNQPTRRIEFEGDQITASFSRGSIEKQLARADSAAKRTALWIDANQLFVADELRHAATALPPNAHQQQFETAPPLPASPSADASQLFVADELRHAATALPPNTQQQQLEVASTSTNQKSTPTFAACTTCKKQVPILHFERHQKMCNDYRATTKTTCTYCLKEITIDKLQSHRPSTLHCPSQCEDCDEIYQFGTNHEQNCRRRPSLCSGCNSHFSNEELANHETSCRYKHSIEKAASEFICVFCLDNEGVNRPEDLRVLKNCGHIFHRACLANMMADRAARRLETPSYEAQCPKCKKKVYPLVGNVIWTKLYF